MVVGGLVKRLCSVKSRLQVTNVKTRHRVAPIGGNHGGRRKDKTARTQAWMGDGKLRLATGPHAAGP